MSAIRSSVIKGLADLRAKGNPHFNERMCAWLRSVVSPDNDETPWGLRMEALTALASHNIVRHTHMHA